MAGGADQAGDLVQASLEKCLHHRDGFTPGTRADAWMSRIIRNCWIDTLRPFASSAANDRIGDQ
ncbi:RNA polymerase sigma factor [Roseovarius sp. D0-M9]|uniref:RNA polymerase sigma factor n=1 Tax=Roseovarius sp. D0-M9 TaxID=3127117 RepID=UPI00300FD516